jgi:hypothetical protein
VSLSVAPALQVEVTEADLAQPSSEEDTSDEAYQAMHAVMAEEERKRFAALLAGKRLGLYLAAGSGCTVVCTLLHPSQRDWACTLRLML